MWLLGRVLTKNGRQQVPRLRLGMTNRKAKARTEAEAEAEADSLRE